MSHGRRMLGAQAKKDHEDSSRLSSDSIGLLKDSFIVSPSRRATTTSSTSRAVASEQGRTENGTGRQQRYSTEEDSRGVPSVHSGSEEGEEASSVTPPRRLARNETEGRVIRQSPVSLSPTARRKRRDAGASSPSRTPQRGLREAGISTAKKRSAGSSLTPTRSHRGYPANRVCVVNVDEEREQKEEKEGEVLHVTGGDAQAQQEGDASVRRRGTYVTQRSSTPSPPSVTTGGGAAGSHVMRRRLTRDDYVAPPLRAGTTMSGDTLERGAASHRSSPLVAATSGVRPVLRTSSPHYVHTHHDHYNFHQQEQRGSSETLHVLPRPPLLTPPLRTAVSPRLMPQHLGRINTATSSNSRTLTPISGIASAGGTAAATQIRSAQASQEEPATSWGGEAAAAAAASVTDMTMWLPRSLSSPAGSNNTHQAHSNRNSSSNNSVSSHSTAPASPTSGRPSPLGPERCQDEEDSDHVLTSLAGFATPARDVHEFEEDREEEGEAVVALSMSLPHAASDARSHSGVAVLAAEEGEMRTRNAAHLSIPGEGLTTSSASSNTLALRPPLSSSSSSSKPSTFDVMTPGGGRVDGMLRAPDRSGFHNSGNNCYACSVLTLLLRCPTFRRALLCSAPVLAELVCTDREQSNTPIWTGSGYSVVMSTAAKKQPHIGGQKRPRSVTASEEGSHNREDEHGGDAREESEEEEDGGDDEDELVAARSKESGVIASQVITFEEANAVVEEDTEGLVLPTVHYVLADFARDLQQTEQEVALATCSCDASTLRQRRKRFLRFVRDNVGQDQYMAGIALTQLEAFFSRDFFTGDQEDAHELFIALIAKLEEEAMSFSKRLVEYRERTQCEQQQQQEQYHQLSQDHMSEVKTDSYREKGEEEGKLAVCTPTHVTASQMPCAASPTTPAAVWVNELIYGKQLNIIRCSHPSCRHEIVSEEAFINLSVSLPCGVEQRTAESHVAAPSLSPSTRNDAEAIAGTEGTTTGQPTTSGATDIAQLSTLLLNNLSYELLEGYSCDACGRTDGQYQGGCFYGSQPPVLVLQLKRFSIEYEGGHPFIVKNATRVRLDDELVIYSLPAAAAPVGEARGSIEHRGIKTEDVPHYYDAEGKHFTDALRCAEQASSAAVATSTVASVEWNGKDAKREEGRDSERQKGVDREGVSTQDFQNESSDPAAIRAVRSVYRLQGTVVHLGSSLHYGHYVAQFRVPQPECLSSASASHRDYEKENNNNDNDNDDHHYQQGTTGTNEEGGAGRRHIRDWRVANDAKVLTPHSLDDVRRLQEGSYLVLYERIKEKVVLCSPSQVLPSFPKM